MGTDTATRWTTAGGRLEWEQPGRKRLGRPRAGWIGGVEEEMDERGHTDGDWSNRDRLREVRV